jgi:hypothetical protein
LQPGRCLERIVRMEVALHTVGAESIRQPVLIP